MQRREAMAGLGGWRVACMGLLVAAACGGDDQSRAPGEELGPCLQGKFCEGELLCVDDVCVNPSQVGTGNASDDATAGNDGVTNAPTDPDTNDPADGTGPPGDGSDGGPTIHCTADTDGCICGPTPEYGPPDAACSEATVTPPGYCCATEGWPDYGGCSCWSLSCRILTFGTCYCGWGTPDPEDEAVGSCSTPPGGVCCRSSSGNTCSCHDDLPMCLEGDETVPSCSTDSLGCFEGVGVSACN